MSMTDYKKQQRKNRKATKKVLWARKSKTDKFATIWLYAFFAALLTALGGLIVTLLVIAYWTLPWYSDVWVTIALAVFGITWWALEQG